MGGLIGQSRAECPVGEGAGAKGLPEGLARVFGHDVLTVIARDQHHYMAGALPALVAAVDLALRLGLLSLFGLCCYHGFGSRSGWRAHHIPLHLALLPPCGVGPLSEVDPFFVGAGATRFHWLKPAASRRANARST